MSESPFAEFLDQFDEEIVVISGAPSLAELQVCVEAVNPDAWSGIRTSRDRSYDGCQRISGVSYEDGHDFVRSIRESRTVASGPAESCYSVICAPLEPGDFDPESAQLRVKEGDWFPSLDEVLIGEFGGCVSKYWNRWEHDFDLDGPRTAIYWFNEYWFPGGFTSRRLLSDNARVDLIVTSEPDVLAALKAPLKRLARRQQAERKRIASQSEIPVAPHSSWVEQAVRDAMDYFPNAPRAQTVHWHRGYRSDGPMDTETIQQIETRFGVTLPSLMVQMLSEVGSSTLTGSTRVCQKGDEVHISDDAWFYDATTNAEWRPTRPLSKLIVITGDGHDQVCLDYRRRGRHHEPQMTLIDNEDGKETTIAASFAEYLGLVNHQSLRIPTVPGTTVSEVVKQLASDIADLEIRTTKISAFVEADGQSVCWVGPELIAEYSDCEIMVGVEASDYLGSICKSLGDASLLEGSLPLQSWQPII